MRHRKSPITPALTNAMQSPLDLSELNGKAADRRFLDSIRPIIEQAQREGEARGTLKATVEAQKRAAAEKARREAEITAAISVVADKEKDRLARKNAAPDNRPTPERLAKLMGAEPITPPIDGTQTIMKAHLTQGVVEFYRDKWSEEELQGARYLVKIWHSAASGGQRTTATYNGVPGGVGGPRDGGVRRVGKGPEIFLDAHNQLLNVEGILFAHFGNKGLSAVRAFAWETLRVAQEGAPMVAQMEAGGRMLAPFAKSSDRLWGITFGWLSAIFRFSYAEWCVKEEAMKRQHSSPQQIAARRAHRVRKMEQQGLLRADQDGPAFKNGGKA